MKYLTLFTISPVQSFISQARKTADMYNGSKILSDIINETIKNYNKDIDIIFPSYKGNGNNSMPNKFIARIEKKGDLEIKDFCKEIEKNIKLRFAKIAEDVLNDKKEKKTDSFEKQINNFLEVFWVAMPETENYANDFVNLESYIAAIKNTRIFEQISELGRKCSLCGERNVLFCGKGNKSKMELKPKNMNELTEEEKELLSKYNNNLVEVDGRSFRKSEGLCAVCFTKRFYRKEPFHSTAGIAVMDIIKKLEKYPDVACKLEKFKVRYDSNIDEQLYYEENLNEHYFLTNNLEVKLPDIKNEYDKIKKKLKELNLDFPKYYATLMFDGDNMGEWLSGSNLKDGIDLEKFHKKLSSNLAEFAKFSREYLDEPRGKAIYAGGDDFLGFINLNYLFEVLLKFRERFNEIVNDPLEEFKKHVLPITYSAGIVIAHYKIPLSEVIKWCRRMEEESKNMDSNKNKFSIAVLKHSGEINKATFDWYEGDTSLVSVLDYILGKLDKICYSNNFIKTLNLEFSKLLKRSKNINSNVIDVEIKRTVERSCLLKRKDGEEDEQFRKRKRSENEELFNQLNKLKPRRAENFLSALNIIDFMHREKKNGN